MSDPRDLPPSPPIVGVLEDIIPARQVRATFHREESAYTLVTYEIKDMTPQAAQAAIEVARNTYAVPAQEATKREYAKYIATGACVLVAVVTAGLVPAAAPWLAGIVAVLGGALVADRAISKKSESSGRSEAKPPDPGIGQ